MKNIQFKFIPYDTIKENASKKIVNIVKKGHVVVLDVKLKAEEEAKIIQNTMKYIDEDFKGIEISSLDLNNKDSFGAKLKNYFIEKITGKKQGFTIIGPSKLIKNIKKKKTDILFEFN